jgi:hypothetical protein
MSSRKVETAPFKDMKESSLKSFLAKLRKRHIIETLAAFIGGGWLEIALSRGCVNYPLLAEKDPFLANIRGEERF